MTYEEWEKIDKALEGYFPRTYQLPAESKLFWFAELQGFDAQAVTLAARHLARTVDAFPSLAQLINAIQGDTSDHAALAWEEVVEKASQLVYPKFIGTPAGRREVPIEWRDPYALDALNAVGGARAYLETDAAHQGVIRKHFTTAYEAIVTEAKRAGRYTPPPPKAEKPALPVPPPTYQLPAPEEIVPMPEDFPKSWRRILAVDSTTPRPRDERPEGMKTIEEKQRPGAQVERLADVVKKPRKEA